MDAYRARGVLYIREVAVHFEVVSVDWKQDHEARVPVQPRPERSPRRQNQPPLQPSDSSADTIIDIAATFGVDTVILGGSRRATLVNLLKGNVVTRVAGNLPEPMHLIVIG